MKKFNLENTKTTETLTDDEISDMLMASIGDDFDVEYETSEETTPEMRFTLAINEMNECLKIRNLPDVEIMIDYFKKDHPEYCI